MSHITTYKTKIKNIEALRAALDALQSEGRFTYQWLGSGAHSFYSDTVYGTAFKLSGWGYPICISPDGDLHFDTYRGKPNCIDMLDQVVQRYTQNIIADSAHKQGYQVNVTVKEDGTVRLRCYI